MLSGEESDRSADGPTPSRGSPESLFVAHLGLVDLVTGFLARRHLLTTAEAEDLSSRVKLKLIENDYEVLRKFQGRSSMKTYLTVVAQRVFLDQCAAESGKWRPSAEAKRLGPVALRLEALTVRDGLGFDEACQILRTNFGVAESRDVLHAMAQKLPQRARRRFVGEEAIAGMADDAAGPDARVHAVEDEAAMRTARSALRAALAGLTGQDRLILRMRFTDSFQVAEIASALRLDAKPLYKRLEKLLAQLRTGLERAGIERTRILDLLGRSSNELAAGLTPAGIGVRHPSRESVDT